jgi:hypothetical protein
VNLQNDGATIKILVILVLILMKLEFSRQSFGNVKFHENPSSASLVFPSGRRNKHNKANNRFSEFSELASEPLFLSILLMPFA